MTDAFPIDMMKKIYKLRIYIFLNSKWVKKKAYPERYNIFNFRPITNQPITDITFLY